MDFTEEIEEKLKLQADGGARVLVTGGAGYLGSILVEQLVSRGFNVTVIDNLLYSQNTLFHLFHTGKLNFVYGDVTNKDFMKKIFQEKYDYIFPLAAVVGFPVSETKPEITWMTNHKAICDILELRGDGKIIFPTTNSGYGVTTGEIHCIEESPLTPISVYGQTKVAAEKEIMNAKNSICYRLATLFGFSPRMRTDLLVNDFTYKAVNEHVLVLFEKHFKRNFLHVRDATRAFLWGIANWDAMKDNIYNVGHPDYNISKEELALLIKKQVPALNIFYSETGKDPDKRNYIISNDKILKTGFTFKHSLEDGISELIRGYEAFRDYRFKNY